MKNASTPRTTTARMRPPSQACGATRCHRSTAWSAPRRAISSNGTFSIVSWSPRAASRPTAAATIDWIFCSSSGLRACVRARGRAVRVLRDDRFVVEDDGDRQPRDFAARPNRVADRLADLVVGRLGTARDNRTTARRGVAAAWRRCAEACRWAPAATGGRQIRTGTGQALRAGRTGRTPRRPSPAGCG